MSEKNFHFFALLSRMKYITRWGLMRNTIPENIQEHSLQVAMIAHALAIIKNKYFTGNINADRAAVLGIFHDCDEIITGDMPTPIKYYNPEINMVYKNIEEVSKTKLLSMLPQELAEEYRPLLHGDKDSGMWKLVKSADRISAYLKCIEEIKAGNNEFKKAGEAIYKTIMEIDAPEVRYFMEKYVPSFSLSLDELD